MMNVQELTTIKRKRLPVKILLLDNQRLGIPLEHRVGWEQTRTRVTGAFRAPEGLFRSLAGVAFEGYEIHMGRPALGAAHVDLVAFEGYQRFSFFG